MRYPKLSPLKLFAPAAPHIALAEAGGSMMFASGSDDEGYGGSRRDGGRNDPSRASGDGSRIQRGGSGGGGRQRTVQFQPEERYWTEYLRIALPIIGLLLMIGLFWYWAQQLINDPANPAEPTTTVTPRGVPEMIADKSTPEPTTASAVNPDPTSPPKSDATEPPANGNQGDITPTGESATEPPAETSASDGGGELAIGGNAVINDDGVNLRPGASTTGDPIMTLNADTAVTIADGPKEAENHTWWQIVVDGTGETGWVAADYLSPAP